MNVLRAIFTYLVIHFGCVKAVPLAVGSGVKLECLI